MFLLRFHSNRFAAPNCTAAGLLTELPATIFGTLSSHAQPLGAGVGKERGAHELVHVAGEVGEVYVGNAREVAGDLGEEFAGEQAERGAFERTVIDVTVAAGRDVREQPDSHRGRQVKIPAEVARDIRPLDCGAAGAERIHQRAYAGEDCRLGADEARQVALSTDQRVALW